MKSMDFTCFFLRLKHVATRKFKLHLWFTLLFLLDSAGLKHLGKKGFGEGEKVLGVPPRNHLILSRVPVCPRRRGPLRNSPSDAELEPELHDLPFPLHLLKPTPSTQSSGPGYLRKGRQRRDHGFPHPVFSSAFPGMCTHILSTLTGSFICSHILPQGVQIRTSLTSAHTLSFVQSRIYTGCVRALASSL